MNLVSREKSMEESTPKLQPSQLYEKRKVKDSARLRSYNKILDQIYNRVLIVSKLPNNQCYLLYTVPPFILGLPKFDMEDCIVYIVYQLRQTGYEVRYTFPNLIYISWMHHEKNYILEHSPIMNAMLQSAENAQKEKEKTERAKKPLGGPKTQKNPWGQILHNAKDAYGIPHIEEKTKKHVTFSPSQNSIKTVLSAGPTPPSARDYVPPPYFLQTLQNPKNDGSHNDFNYFK